MRFPRFDMERMQSTWEHKIRYDLSESGVEALTLEEITRDPKELMRTGLGYAEGFDGRSAPASDTLIQGSVDATLTALKRLEGDGARLLLVIESTARHRALGAAAADEWAAIKGTIDSRTPCVGWLCDHVAAYGRGVRPVDAHGSLVVVALGDTPRR